MSSGGENRRGPTQAEADSFSAWFRSWRYFFLILGLGLLIALFYGEENWRGKRSWENYKRTVRARGELVEPKALVPPLVPDGKNFAMTPLLAPLFEFIPGTQRWRDTNAFQRIQGISPRYDAAAHALKEQKNARSNSWVTARTDLTAWHQAFLQATNRANPIEMVFKPIEGQTTNRADLAAIRQAAAGVLTGLSECDAILEQLRADSQRPNSRFNIRYNEADPAGILLPHLAVLKHLCQILQLRASAELALGRTEEAFADVELMFKLIDACREEPILISQLVRMAMLKLALQPIAEGMRDWSEPRLRALQLRLQQLDFCADMKRALEAERVFFGGGVIEFIRRSPGTYDRTYNSIPNGPVFPGAVWAVVPGGWFDLEKLNYCRLFEEYMAPGIDLTNRQINPSAARHAEERITALLGKSPPSLFLHHRLFSGLLMPALPKVFGKAAFAQTGADLAAIACGLERYRRAEGKLPAALEALSPKFVDKLPRDIVNGQPIKYRLREDDDYILYSVGWNETDEGGRVVPGKATQRELPGEGDWVWQRN